MRWEIQESSQYREKVNGKKKTVKAKINHVLKGDTENKDNCIKKKNIHISHKCQKIKEDLPEERQTLSVLNLVNYLGQRNRILLTDRVDTEIK